MYAIRSYYGCQSGAVGNAKDMGIDSDGWLAEGRVEHDIGGLASYAWQGLQFLTRGRHTAAVTLYQYLAGSDDIDSLGVVKADTLNMAFDAPHTESEHGTWSYNFV